MSADFFPNGPSHRATAIETRVGPCTAFFTALSGGAPMERWDRTAESIARAQTPLHLEAGKISTFRVEIPAKVHLFSPWTTCRRKFLQKCRYSVSRWRSALKYLYFFAGIFPRSPKQAANRCTFAVFGIKRSLNAADHDRESQKVHFCRLQYPNFIFHSLLQISRLPNFHCPAFCDLSIARSSLRANFDIKEIIIF